MENKGFHSKIKVAGEDGDGAPSLFGFNGQLNLLFILPYSIQGFLWHLKINFVCLAEQQRSTTHLLCASHDKVKPAKWEVICIKKIEDWSFISYLLCLNLPWIHQNILFFFPWNGKRNKLKRNQVSWLVTLIQYWEKII